MSRVLIVDDDRAIRELLRFALECEGYDVTTLCDGASVVSVLEERPDPCVILTDLMMPYVDGWEVCQHLREHSGMLPLYRLALMTGSDISTQECPEEIHALIRKPFELDKVVQLVAALSTFASELPPAHECIASHQVIAS